MIDEDCAFAAGAEARRRRRGGGSCALLWLMMDARRDGWNKLHARGEDLDLFWFMVRHAEVLGRSRWWSGACAMAAAGLTVVAASWWSDFDVQWRCGAHGG